MLGVVGEAGVNGQKGKAKEGSPTLFHGHEGQPIIFDIPGHTSKGFAHENVFDILAKEKGGASSVGVVQGGAADAANKMYSLAQVVAKGILQDNVPQLGYGKYQDLLCPCCEEDLVAFHPQKHVPKGQEEDVIKFVEVLKANCCKSSHANGKVYEGPSGLLQHCA